MDADGKGIAPIDGLPGLSDAVLQRLRGCFSAAGFNLQLVEQAELFVPGVLRGPRVPLVRWWLARRPEPGAILARLFVYQEEFAKPQLNAVMEPELVDALIDAGVLGAATDNGGQNQLDDKRGEQLEEHRDDQRDGPGDRRGDGHDNERPPKFAARFLFMPTAGGLWLLSDSLAAGRDAVMGPGGGTEYLGRLVSPPFTGTALDLGTGAGSLALMASRLGARRAVGVDINPRAIEIARFNARLNNLEAEFLVGDIVAPVATQSFDLILAQPPFVVRPTDAPEVTYLHGGPTGDELPLRFLGEIPRVLAPGGRALLLMQTVERDDQPLAARLRRAIPHDPPLDMLVIALEAPPAAAQASVFASYEDSRLGDRYATAALRLMDHFEQQGIRAFVTAVVVLSRPAERQAAENARYTLGLKLAHGFYDAAALDGFLAGLDLIERSPTFLEREQLRLSPLARVTPDASGAAQGEMPRAVIRIPPPGIGTDWTLGADELQLLATIDSSESVAGALAKSARDRQVSPEALRGDFLAFIRAALVRGALVRKRRIVTP